MTQKPEDRAPKEADGREMGSVSLEHQDQTLAPLRCEHLSEHPKRLLQRRS